MSKYIAKCLHNLGENKDTSSLKELVTEFDKNPTQDLAAELVTKITNTFAETIELVDLDNLTATTEEFLPVVLNIKIDVLKENKDLLDVDHMFQLNSLIGAIELIDDATEEIKPLFKGMIMHSRDEGLNCNILELILRDKIGAMFPDLDVDFINVLATNEGICLSMNRKIVDESDIEDLQDIVHDMLNDLTANTEEGYEVTDDKPVSPLN